jgi:DNA excision repair protein ERCC-3
MDDIAKKDRYPLTKKIKHNLDISSLFGNKDYSGMLLKPNHHEKPLWVCANGHVFLDSSVKNYANITDFLIAIAEPVSRPENIHEYVLTRYSLYAAVSVKLETDYILSVLAEHSKTVEIPKEIIEFIQENTNQYGKAKLVLRHNRYFIESTYEGVLNDLLSIPSIRLARDSVERIDTEGVENNVEDIGEELNKLMDHEASVESEKVESFEINSDYIEAVRRDCHDMNFPLLEEYDFMNDLKNPRLDIDLKPSTHIRSYQEKSLSKMFSNGRARSGVIVLPCGAGKTLVGITATCTVKKRTVVLCTSGVAVEQWKRQYELWSTIDPANIIKFTSTNKDRMVDVNEACILISTYSMLGFSGRRSAESQEIFEKIKQVEWGLLVMDEVQVVPADMFRKVIFEVKSHCKLGLTATLVREDKRIEDLNFLIGPKLYEANWLELQNMGFLARVQCIEVWCPMTAEFFQEYLNARPRKKITLYVANPNKLMACQYLVRKHEAQGDKVIIFSDNLFVLELYGQYLRIPIISGRVGHQDRLRILYQFEHTRTCNTILVSKVGDNSIDLPGANVIIQISSHFGSRRQEAQRLGRILRPKSNVFYNEFNAYFYSLVSQDTNEMWYADKRQQFLIDQGYSYKVISLMKEMLEQTDLMFYTKADQKNLLERILQAREVDEEIDEDPDDITPETLSRKTGNLANITGNSGVYHEYNIQPKQQQNRHWLFAKRYKSSKPGGK